MQTLNVTNTDVTGTYCDVFVVDATANLFGGTYTNTNKYPKCTSPALKVWNGGTLSVNGATVDCLGGNAAISSGEPAGSDYDDQAGGKLVVENCTIENSKYGIYLGPGQQRLRRAEETPVWGTTAIFTSLPTRSPSAIPLPPKPPSSRLPTREEGRRLTVLETMALAEPCEPGWLPRGV